MYSVYRIWNNINSKYYIGSAYNVKKRWSQHKNFLNKGLHHNKYLQHAWNKYGEKAFTFEVLIYVWDDFAMLDREQFYIDMALLINPNSLYNINLNVKGFHGRRHSQETKFIMSNKRKGVSLTKGEMNPNAKLNWDVIYKIRNEAKTTNVSFAELGRRYGISYQNISLIVKNKIWKNDSNN